MKKEITSNTLMEAGVHYGYSRTRRHPTVSGFIYGNKKGSDIINIEKVMPQIEEAAKFMSEIGASGKVALFVGVKPEARASIEEVATFLKQPFVTERWIGGTLTNFVEIKRRIQKLEEMREKIANGEFSKYTKKEQLLLTREMEKLNKYFSGLVGMNKMPDVFVVVDAKKEHIAVAEARRMNIPVISISNTDTSVRNINFPIVANDGSLSSIKIILDILKDAFVSVK